MLITKLLQKIIRCYYYIQVRVIFKKVQCNLSKLCFGADVAGPFSVSFPENLVIGDGSSIGGRLYVHALGGVEIGCCCHIAQGLTVYSHNHNWKSEKSIPYDDIELIRPVTIGDAVWVGANVTIAPGATIGNGVIVSSGSVVFGDIPDCAIIRGNPAEIVSYRNKEVFYRLYMSGEMV